MLKLRNYYNRQSVNLTKTELGQNKTDLKQGNTPDGLHLKIEL